MGDVSKWMILIWQLTVNVQTKIDGQNAKLTL